MSDDADDALVERIAEVLYEIEYPAYDEGAHEDSNQWTWRGNFLDPQFAETCRRAARRAVTNVKRERET